MANKHDYCADKSTQVKCMSRSCHNHVSNLLEVNVQIFCRLLYCTELLYWSLEHTVAKLTFKKGTYKIT